MFSRKTFNVVTIVAAAIIGLSACSASTSAQSAAPTPTDPDIITVPIPDPDAPKECIPDSERKWSTIPDDAPHQEIAKDLGVSVERVKNGTMGTASCPFPIDREYMPGEAPVIVPVPDQGSPCGVRAIIMQVDLNIVENEDNPSGQKQYTTYAQIFCAADDSASLPSASPSDPNRMDV